MESTQCKNLRKIFRRYACKGERPGEVYAYSITFCSLEEARKEQVKEIAKLKNANWLLTIPSKRMEIEDKIKMLEESISIIDKFMEWENKEYDGVV